MIDRRQLLGAAALAFATPAAAATTTGRLREAAREAWSFTLPLMEIGRTRHARAPLQGVNRLNHARRLSDHTARTVTTPNNDTLYSTAQLDLSRGPVTLTVPSGRARYLSVALMDAYSNNFAVMGTRATPDGGTFTIVGPGGRAGEGVIVSPTNHVWCLGRTLVASPEDFAEARRIAGGIVIAAPEGAPAPQPVPARTAGFAEYFTAASHLLRLNPPPAADRGMLARIAPLGLGPNFRPDAFGAAEAAEIEAGMAEAHRLARSGMTEPNYVDGWSYPKANLGDFGTDYAYRAAVALGGLAALPLDEAMYMKAQGDGRDRLFRPGGRWRLRLPADGLPPVDAFWSLSMYEATSEGQFFFAENPIGRYAIGDRTPGLVRGADGSIDIWIGHDDPGPERRANWLPAPDRPFTMHFRAYLPKPEMRSGRYRLPRLERA